MSCERAIMGDDWIYVPGVGDRAIEGLAELLYLRPHKSLVLTPPMGVTLSDFLGAVDRSIRSNGYGPAADLIIGAHGDEEGNLYLALDANASVPAKYEAVKNCTTIGIPPAVKDANTWVRLESCLLGRDECHQFLVALKAALGNPAKVTASRHLHAQMINYYAGDWEFMLYFFSILGADRGKKPLLNRDAVLAAFADKAYGFQFVGPQDIPTDKWDDWVPKAARLILAPSLVSEAKVPFLVFAPNVYGVLNLPLSLYTRWVAWVERTTLPPLECDFIPVGADLIASTLKELLGGIDEYKDTHPYSVPRRYLNKNLDDFTNGWNWIGQDDPPPGQRLQYSLTYSGYRYRYRLEIPITKPGTNQLIYNYYPTDGSAPTVNFSETNDPYNFYGAA
jgi:hypothetical protein